MVPDDGVHTAPSTSSTARRVVLSMLAAFCLALGALSTVSILSGGQATPPGPPLVASANAGSAASVDPAAAPSSPTGLVAERAQLPDFPSDAELEAAAAQVPVDDKQSFYPGDVWAANSLYPASNAVPMFSFKTNELVGIYVSGLGIVDRFVYDDPDVDFEELARGRFGDAEYDARIAARSSMQACAAPADSRDGVIACLGE